MLQQLQNEMERGCKNSRLNRNILKTLRVIIDKIHVIVHGNRTGESGEMSVRKLLVLYYSYFKMLQPSNITTVPKSNEKDVAKIVA